MQHIIKNKTQELLDRLSDQHMYYTPNDLLDAGYPEFLVERIRLEVERNLADSVSLPESEWADMRADQVQDAWDHFLNAIRAETRIPVSYCKSVTENAVEDVLDLFSKPRNYILETLFRDEQEARFDELVARRKWIVIHGVLADSVLRYMQRKNLTSLSREKAEYVLVEVDKKLTSGFTPLKWAQHLDMLFQFLGNQVPSRILSEYFVDRGMLSESKQINRGNDVVTRSAFIEIISEAGIYEDDEANESPFTATRNDSSTITDPANRVDFTITPDFSDVHVETPKVKTDEISTDDLNSDDVSTKDTITLEEAFELDQQSPSINDLNSIEDEPFNLDDDEPVEENSDLSDDESEQFVSIADQFQIESDDEIEESPISESVIGDQNTDLDIENDTSESTYENASGNESIQDNTDNRENSTPDIDDDSHVIYLTERAKQLLVVLEPNLEEFIIEIFLNDELEFYKHLENITAYTEWRMAGRYITRDVFDKNRIDLYSEPAVMFTDAVQEFFDQNEN